MPYTAVSRYLDSDGYSWATEIECDDCGSRFSAEPSANGAYSYEQSDALHDDFLNHCQSCDGCSGLFCPSVLEYNEDDCAELCERCTTRDELLPHYYAPTRWSPKGNYHRETLMGIELEMDGPQRAIIRIAKEYGSGHLFVVRDGSVPYGAEIVSHPQTLQWATDCFDYSGMLEALLDVGCQVSDNHGLHIHVSRNAFRRSGRRSRLATYLWASFIYANAPIMSIIGRRDPEDWGRFTCPHYRSGASGSEWWRIPTNCGDCYRLMDKATMDTYGHDRYSAMNWNNGRTIELRFPASTLCPETFYGTLQLVDATVDYAKQMGYSGLSESMRFSNFLRWIADDGNRRFRYGELVEMCEGYGITPDTDRAGVLVRALSEHVTNGWRF